MANQKGIITLTIFHREVVCVREALDKDQTQKDPSQSLHLFHREGSIILAVAVRVFLDSGESFFNAANVSFYSS